MMLLLFVEVLGGGKYSKGSRNAESKEVDHELPAKYPPKSVAESMQKLPKWQQAGLGDAPYYWPATGKTYPSDQCPEFLGDLSKHENFMAQVFKQFPELYDELKQRKTSLGVSLAKCIKTGMDNPSHPHIKTVGLVAGDEECFTVFKELFDPVIAARHGGYPADAKHETCLDLSQVTKRKLDPTGK